MRNTLHDHASRIARAERRWLVEARDRLRSTIPLRATPPAATAPREQREQREQAEEER